MGIQDLAKLLYAEKKNKTLSSEFKHTYYKTVLAQNPDHKPKVDMFSPSSLYKCERELYYMIMGYEKEPSQVPVHLLGSWRALANTGTDRHERIQTTITKMKENGMDIEWIDVEKYVNEHGPETTKLAEETDPEKAKAAKEDSMETKLYSSVISSRFKCDGLVLIDGEYYIIEIKTMNSRKWSKSKTKGDILDEHELQASAYSIAIGVDNVLYIYENRDNGQLLVFEKEVTSEMKHKVMNKILTVQEYKRIGKIPPKKNCDMKFCDYKRRCEMDGQTADLFGDHDFSEGMDL